jgi:hypothetical protein
MTSHKNFSQKSRKEKEGSYNNFENSSSHDPINEENLNYEEWAKFLSYYRYYVDEFASDILKCNVFPFQRLILRSMARYQNNMLICCRGLGKSYISALFMICMAILLPGVKIGIASGKGQQARNVIIQKIKGELSKNENIAREIKFPIKTGSDDCVVEFKNGSEIRAIVLGQNQSGDSARSWRFHILLCDEARLILDSVVEEILVPMTKTKRQNIIDLISKYPDMEITEKGKMIYISSAYLKTCDLYKRFIHHYTEMTNGSKEYFVCSLDYRVGVQARIFDEDDILKEKDKPSMTLDKFTYEYLGQFVGSSNESYYPYELTEKCRVLEDSELEQPKKSSSIYIITHDVAVSDVKGSDNACTHVIKLKPKTNGSFTKEVVFTKTLNGASLQEQRDFLRELIHIKFPNTEKIIIDAQSAGQGLLSLFYETWEHKNSKGEVIEYPPIIKDDDEEGKRLQGAKPMIRAIMATNTFNTEYYPYMKSCFEDGSLRLLISSSITDEKYKSAEITPEQQAVHIEHDFLIQELSNIKQSFTEFGKLTYARIVQRKKRDRATSLMYGLSYVHELEQDGRANLYRDNTSDFEFLAGYAFF